MQPLSLSPAPSLSILRRAAIAWPPSKIQFRRCPLKPPLRIKSVSTKVSEAEFVMLEERARANGLTLSEWVRDVLLAASVDGGPESGEVVLAELLALRSLFLNLHFRTGEEPLTEAEMRGLIERADGVKMQRARERLAVVRTETRKADGETNPEEG